MYTKRFKDATERGRSTVFTSSSSGPFADGSRVGEVTAADISAVSDLVGSSVGSGLVDMATFGVVHIGTGPVVMGRIDAAIVGEVSVGIDQVGVVCVRWDPVDTVGVVVVCAVDVTVDSVCAGRVHVDAVEVGRVHVTVASFGKVCDVTGSIGGVHAGRWCDACASESVVGGACGGGNGRMHAEGESVKTKRGLT